MRVVIKILRLGSTGALLQLEFIGGIEESDGMVCCSFFLFKSPYLLFDRVPCNFC